MNLDTYLDRSEGEVNQAIVQFAARRSYRVRQPWYLKGLRIEATYPRSAGSSGADRRGRVDLELKRKRGRTRLRINVGHSTASARLAYELRNYLKDDRAYNCQCPPMCPKCGSAVPNIQARYCGRCGQRLFAPEVAEPPPVAARARPLPTPPVSEPEPIVASRPQAVPAPVPQAAPVVVERDVEPTIEAAPVEAVTEAKIAEEDEIADADQSMPASDQGQSHMEEEAVDPEPQEEDRPRRALAED